MRLDSQIARYYYTAAQARKELGLDEEAFQYWVRKGRINKVMLPGRKQGLYSKKEVNMLRDQITATILSEAEEVEFRKATIDDLEQEAQLAHLIFGEKAEALNERKAFLEKNPDVDYHVYSQGKLVAYINIVPLKHKAIEDFLKGKIIAWQIDPNDIEQFTSREPVECLIIDMITTPTVPPLERRLYGSRLLTGLLKTLGEMGRQGIEITKVYAASATPGGIRILKTAGFQIIHETRKGRLSFELDIANSDEKILKEYKDALKEWKERVDK